MLKLERINWLRVALAWGLFTAFMVVVVYAQALPGARPVPWRTAVLGPLLYGLIWLLFTPGIFWLATRFDLTAGRRGWVASALVHAGASVVLTVLFRALYLSVLVVSGAPNLMLTWTTILSGINIWLPAYWMLLCVAYALEFYARYERRTLDAAHLEMQLVQAQLQALKMQLQPHFLFNTLNSIATLIDDEPRTAQRMTAKLGEFLRLVLDNTDEHQVTLAQELHFAELYLEMEQIRFSDRLTITYQLAPDTLPALVPNLLLQPLIENAVKHGLTAEEGAAIHIQADRQQGQLVLQVRDNGRGTAQADSRGVGLRNSEERLRALYGSRCSLAIHTAPQQGYAVRIEFPFVPHA
ncbi:sensor histidine kinase [Hymenobacter mucosus]|uniref:Histidine kinase-, DNA gyrase B-, and HSP90-like ATPase n=1 Tax=Hymenobacter mucosus TaxID=1411120 RepID=A0A239AJN3_9BACT|nr:sensor histidine kinase [Hymenobacter mucosus]SNR95591.1 Histidine kinase-, DNA gyrase B-, and HSP90-like ATPase [Hymenobacter mucosus]